MEKPLPRSSPEAMVRGFNQKISKQMPISDQILFSIYSVISSREKCDFERLIKECFTLFPETFSFSKYPQWPDSRKLDRPLRTLRQRKLIKGDPKTFFTLTKTGQKIAIETARTFRQRKLFK